MTQAFTGEVMRCIHCGAEQKSDPARSSDWRMLELDGERFYVCPKEFPADGASVSEFTRAYAEILLSIRKKKAAR
jgi:hypothetical protein